MQPFTLTVKCLSHSFNRNVSFNPRVTIYELLKRRTPQPGGGGCAPRTYGRRGGGGEVRADLGSHKPVRVGKRRPESTASIRSSNNPVTVIDYANSNHNPNANGVDSARLLPPRTGL